MKKTILALVCFFSLLYSRNDNTQIEINSSIINKIQQNEKQKDIFEKQKNNLENIKQNKVYEINPINILVEYQEEDCIEIEEINIELSTVISVEELSVLKEPYLNNCKGIKGISNLVKKISNVYIKKGYITSRAYIKPQDLSDGIVDISILEGKVEKVKTKNINVVNLFGVYTEKILNVRDLEVAIQQAERLRSQKINFQLLPGSKIGYSIIDIRGSKVNVPYYGNYSLNNFGSKQNGKYQISMGFNYENPFELNDIFSLNLNTTNRIANKYNITRGASLSYSIPYHQLLFNFDYSTSVYKQLNKDEFQDNYISKGDTQNFLIGTNYKAFHTRRETLEVNAGFEYKKSNNYLNDIKLEIQSYKLFVFNLGVKHTYKDNFSNYYGQVTFFQGSDLFGTTNSFADQENDFQKLVVDMGLSNYFKFLEGLKYDFSFRSQYSYSNLYGTEEISIGGPYSVRGFKKSGISGKRGFYTRNELSYLKNVFNYFIALDYGQVKEYDNSSLKKVLGSAIGLRANNINNKDFELFYTHPIKGTNKLEEENENFLGIKVSLKY